MTKETVICVENLSKRYMKQSGEAFYALKNVSFQVAEGEVVGIVGRNGAGKSTLLHILSGITKPSSGRAILNGRLTSILDIGTGFHPDLTGRENVFLKAQLSNLSKKEVEHVLDELIEFSELGDFFDEPVKHYSNGMYMRLAFSMFVYLKPEILLLDEVFSVGDLAFQEKCKARIKELIQQGSTILIVAHNMVEIAGMCKRVIILDRGEVIQDGPTGEVVNDYVLQLLEHSNGGNKAFDKREVKFDEPLDNGLIKMHRAAIYATGKSPKDDIFADNDVIMEFDYEKISPGSVQFVISIGTPEHGNILTDSEAFREHFQPTDDEQGHYVLSVEIPGNLLNRGVYYLTVTISRNYDTENNDSMELTNILAFKVRESKWSEHKDWTKQITAPLMPQFKWKKIACSNAST